MKELIKKIGQVVASVVAWEYCMFLHFCISWISFLQHRIIIFILSICFQRCYSFVSFPKHTTSYWIIEEMSNYNQSCIYNWRWIICIICIACNGRISKSASASTNSPWTKCNAPLCECTSDQSGSIISDALSRRLFVLAKSSSVAMCTVVRRSRASKSPDQTISSRHSGSKCAFASFCLFCNMV